ncbi:CdaR family protein [Geomesophilobacter sediminis]|uniref:YbbR-like domain-containing protein n=1 Tax=Geomesophilobacter sediminis TaxID=2798584 RepID=A0A8J7S879_9BACT|nr:CdaR family protein [Geomesophilobacter sediminis]MBJ6727496.1 hypothetical protein [Geomesophilobacter sediminis]
MSRSGKESHTLLVRALSVVLAFLLWFSLVLERHDELSLTVPVQVEGIAPGLTLGSPPPKTLEMKVSGPRIVLLRARLGEAPVYRVDLSRSGAGVTTFAAPERLVKLDPELTVETVFPGSFSVTLQTQATK